MRAKKKVLFLGPAYPYRGGIADTQNYLAKNLVKLGHEVLVLTFYYQYPKILFPGKTQYSKDPKPIGVNIKRKVHSLNPINWIKVSNEINDYSPNIVFFSLLDTISCSLLELHSKKTISKNKKGSLC